MNITHEQRRHAQDLLDFIDSSPSPWHVVDTLARRLNARGYSVLQECESWPLTAGGRHYVIRGGSSLIAFQVGKDKLADTGFRLIGAHTDSPGLRLKPKAAQGDDHLVRLGVEVYGGPILATFTDRDLGLAGRICLRTPTGIQTRLMRFDSPVVRLPNLAIHMNRKVNEEGLKLDKQTELPLMLGQPENGRTPQEHFLNLLARRADCQPADLLSFELNVYDTQKGGFWGPENEYLAASQLDNLTSCHAAAAALQETGPVPHTAVCAFFDHEEIGSRSHKGADGGFLADVLERIAESRGESRSDYQRALARSQMISADAAHAHHPNYPSAYEPLHAIRVNAGPTVKINANQRYATDGPAEALFKELGRLAGVNCQVYVHRTDLGCGSTIGPLIAARFGSSTIDCGTPLWAMHSIRESAGVLDQWNFAKLLTVFLGNEWEPPRN
jgi:aspartyl aminopeptidase